MEDKRISFYIVKVSASSSYKHAKTIEKPTRNQRVTQFKIPLGLVKDFETWRIKLSYQLNKYGFKSNVWGVRLYSASVKPMIVQIIERAREAYYRLVERIPDEELRGEFSFNAMFAQFTPLEPTTSEIIADVMTQVTKDISFIVDDLTASVNSQEELVTHIKMFEDKLANLFVESSSDSVVIWSKKFIILIARICALATFSFDKRKARALMMHVAKLRSFMPPFNPSIKSLVEMVYSLVSKMISMNEPLKKNDVEKLIEKFLS